MSNSCLGSAESLKVDTKLIRTNVCHSFRHICDGTTFSTIFLTREVPEVSGIFTVTNSSSACTIDLVVTDANGAGVVYTIPPQSSVAITTEAVTNISYTCTGPDPTALCNGYFEANFYYCVDC